MKALLFGGTGEGRALAEWMLARGLDATVCVATEYGETLLPEGMQVHVGRLDADGMAALMADDYTLVIDATHPYAVEVTENIRAASERTGLPYLRLLRQSDGEDLCHKAENMAVAAEMLEGLPGNVLLTTGSKELDHFARPGLRERCFPRVLPMADSLERSGAEYLLLNCAQGLYRDDNPMDLHQYAETVNGLMAARGGHGRLFNCEMGRWYTLAPGIRRD